MGDLHDEAHHMYTKLMTYKQSKMGQLDEDSQKHILQQQQNIYALILQFLCVCPPTGRFKYGEIVRIISDSTTVKTFDPEKARQAFLCLEDYIILLYLMPWKMEYHAIKKYGGHYQTKVASHIKGAEIVLRLVGFTDLSTGLMILSHHTKPDVLQYIAFECLVASAECLILSQIWRKIDHAKLGMKDLVQIRLQHSGNADAVISVIESKFGSVKCDTIKNRIVSQRTEAEDGRTVTERKMDSSKFRDKLHEHIKKAERIGSSDQHHDIPYMDEDVTKEIERKPEILEDHILASLQLVGDKESAPAPCGVTNKAGQRASQEWSFVREGLEKNYGKRYFDGPREDILQHEDPTYGKDGGYVRIMAQPPYENVKNIVPVHKQKIGKAVSPMPPAVYAGNNTPSFTTADSAYQSESTFFPPRLEDTMVRRGQSEFIVRQEKSSSDPKKTQTAPLARRISNMSTASTASSTYPGSQSHHPVPMDNILKYHKQTSPSSMPIQKECIPETRDMFTDTSTVGPANYRGQSSTLPVSRTNYSMDNTGSSTRRDQFGTPHSNSLNTPASTKHLNAKSSATNPMFADNKVVSQVPVIDRSKKPRQWECPYCTFLNDTPDSICSICSKTRDTMDVDCPLAGDMSRVCDKCTLENTTNCTICTACGNELKGVQTVI